MDTLSLILTVNAGSSSIKMSVFDIDGEQQASMRIENIGQSSTILSDAGSEMDINAPDHKAAIELLASRLFDRYAKERFLAVGHRIVHGGHRFTESTVVSDGVVDDLKILSVFDPVHLPIQILSVEFIRQILVSATHVACFDTAFYRDMPKQARLLPIPRHYYEKGVRRYGFHGLSYSYLLGQLEQVEGNKIANGRVIFAHLGSGASLTAVRQGKVIDTTMSLTSLSGVMMSTRSGDLDPGLYSVLRVVDNMTPSDFDTMISSKSGLLGVSEISADMATLIERYSTDEHAAEAVDLFCYDVQKAIGSLVAVLGGLDTLVFAGGIGENAPFIRNKICESAAHFGVAIDEVANRSGNDRLSPEDSDVIVRIIKTNEESVIAHEVRRLMTEMGV